MNPIAENYNEQLNEVEQLINLHDEETSKKDLYSKLSKEEIITEAESLIQTADVKTAFNNLNALKEQFDRIITSEKPALIKQWIEDGNDVKDFVPPQDSLKVRLLEIFNEFKKLREEEKKRAEEEKLANLRQKQSILEKIKSLVDNEETENSLKHLRELMREWREIRTVPKEFQEELSSQFKALVDKFYDNLSIFNELKDLDREKNLEIKIELIKRVEALKDEKNIRKVLVSLNKHHEDWRNTGPVRKEISEEIWNRFKLVSNEIVESVRAYRAAQDEKRKNNLEKKVLLIEKSEALIAVLPSNGKEWQNVGQELDNLFEEWKKIGPVPSDKNEEVWDRFQHARNTFFSERKQFFKGLNAHKQANLDQKIKLCERAEQLKDSNEFNNTSAALLALQEEWKKIGPVPEDQNEKIWKRFRASFDHFFERKKLWMDERKQNESGAVTAKEEILKELEALASAETKTHTFNDLKAIQQRWNQSGFVSGKKFHSLNNRYQKLIDPMFQSLREMNNAEREKSVRDYVAGLSDSPDGKHKLMGEERKLRDTINKIQDELATIENNKGFFSNSKNAGAVLKQFDDKVKKLNEQLDRLKKELAIIRQAK